MPTAAIANAVPLDWSHGLDTKPLPGFSPDDAGELIGNEIERAYSWKASDDVGALAGKPVRLRFVLRDADLFSFRFE